MCYACRLFAPRLALLLFAPFLATTDMQAARDEANGFSVDFSGCSEFVGWGPIALAPAQAVVAAGYTINVAPNGTAGIVVRATSCQGVSINGSEPRSTNLSQIGVNIASPDGTGTINNYTALYVSNNPQLVEHFRDVGLPADYDRDLLYEFTYDSSGTSGELYVAADGPDIPAYFFSGTESDPPPNSEQPFIANWWFNGRRGVIRQSTDFPQIAFGSAAVTLFTSRFSPLGQLIGGNHDDHFSFLTVRGKYGNAHLDVFMTH
jgi:hypothetical protein